jgi:hypothetical protein
VSEVEPDAPVTFDQEGAEALPGRRPARRTSWHAPPLSADCAWAPGWKTRGCNFRPGGWSVDLPATAARAAAAAAGFQIAALEDLET